MKSWKQSSSTKTPLFSPSQCVKEMPGSNNREIIRKNNDPVFVSGCQNHNSSDKILAWAYFHKPPFLVYLWL
jgi:hypothetical protein